MNIEWNEPENTFRLDQIQVGETFQFLKTSPRSLCMRVEVGQYHIHNIQSNYDRPIYVVNLSTNQIEVYNTDTVHELLKVAKVNTTVKAIKTESSFV